jgi:hypothetical protein
MYVNFESATKKNPELWSSIVSDVKSGGKYGIEGQWNARKASYAVQRYKSAGGEYKGKKPTVKNNGLKKWLKEDWTTYNGKPALEKDSDGNVIKARRYLPKKAWEQLTPAQAGATSRKKNKAFQEGKQFVSNTSAAKKAGGNARNFSYMNS